MRYGIAYVQIVIICLTSNNAQFEKNQVPFINCNVSEYEIIDFLSIQFIRKKFSFTAQ